MRGIFLYHASPHHITYAFHHISTPHCYVSQHITHHMTYHTPHHTTHSHRLTMTLDSQFVEDTLTLNPNPNPNPNPNHATGLAVCGRHQRNMAAPE